MPAISAPPPAPNSDQPGTFAERMDDFLAWLVRIVPQLNDVADLLEATDGALDLGAHTGTLSMARVAGLVAALNTKSNNGHTHAMANVIGLVDALSRRLQSVNASRPGDNPALFAHQRPGDPATKPLFSLPIESAPNLGRVVLATGDALVCTREPIYIGSDRHEVLARVQRKTNPLDPANHAVAFRVGWLDENMGSLDTSANIRTLTNLRTTDNLVQMVGYVSRGGPASDIRPPARAVYFVPYIDTFGDDGATWIDTLRSGPVLTQSVVGETDLTAVIAEARAAAQAAIQAANDGRGEVVLGYAALRAYTPPAGTGAVVLAWGTTPRDRMGGEFVLDVGNTTTPDDGINTIVGVGGRRWYRAGGSGAGADLSGIREDVDLLASAVEERDAAIASYDTRLRALEEDTDSNVGPQITALQNSVAALTTRLNLLESGNFNFPHLTLDGVNLNAGSVPPTYEAPTGSQHFNKAPTVGGPAKYVRAADNTWQTAGIVGGQGGVVTPPTALAWTDLAIPAGDTDAFGVQRLGRTNWKANSPGTAYDFMAWATDPNWVKFRLLKGDRRPGDPPDRYRAEFSGSDFIYTASGGDVWAAFTYIPLSLPNTWWNSVLQVYDDNYKSPALKIEDARGGYLHVNTAGGLSTTRTQVPRWNGDRLQTGRTYNFVVRVRLHPSAGEADIWINGALAVTLRNVPIGQSSNPEVYLKIGGYIWDKGQPANDMGATPWEVIAGNWRDAQGPNALSNLIATPLSIPTDILTRYPMGVYNANSGRYETGASTDEPDTGFSGTVTGANLLDGIQWRLDAAAGTATPIMEWDPDNFRLSLRGTNASYGARARTPTGGLMLPPGTYRLYGDMAGGGMGIRVGTTDSGVDIYGSETDPETIGNGPAMGAQFLVPGTGTTPVPVHIRLNRQSSASTAIYSGMNLRRVTL